MKNRFLGALLSIIFALVGAIPWVILGLFGWIASLAGYLIGLAAHKGYVIGNGEFDKFGKVVLAVVILLVVPAAELVNVFISGLREGISFMDALTYTPAIFIEYFSEFLPGILIGYFMAAWGTYRFFITAKSSTI